MVRGKAVELRHAWRLWWLALLPLTACGPAQDPEGTPFTWWHHLEGGVIAEQRPPPPGVDDPYPHVGTTPARPAVPSKTVRDALTASLAAQRTRTHRRDVDQPIPPAGAPPPPRPGAAAAPASATIEAAGDAPAASPGTPASPPPRPAPLPTPEQQEAREPVLAMPPPPAVTVVASGPLPEMPANPPPPPSFADFDIPTTQVARLTPDYVPEAAHLANIGFAPGSDELLPASRALLDHVARGAGVKPVTVTGFGEARSDLAADQEAAMHLALARAASAAAELHRAGVGNARIKIAASPFGRGGDVTVVQ